MDFRNILPFRILSVTIYDDCSDSVRKNLSAGTYSFGEGTPDGFFGKNVEVTAIVGKNGSGKSSLLEIIFRLLNNFSYHVHSRQRRAASDRLVQAEGVSASMLFRKGNTTGELSCRKSEILLVYGNHKWQISGKKKEGYSSVNRRDYAEVKEISSSLFYSIVTNYSMQSYIAQDYESFQRKNAKNAYQRPSGHKVWLNSLFHKNDGYMCPIVLNPYRDRGVVDTYKEYWLTLQRIASILLEFKRHNEIKPDDPYRLIDGYELDHIQFRFDPKVLMDKYRHYTNRKGYSTYEQLQTKFIDAFSKEGSYVQIILSELKRIKTIPLTPDEIKDPIFIACCMYVVHKVLAIGSRYPVFCDIVKLEDEEKYGGFKMFEKITGDRVDALNKLVAKIAQDKSHITTKFKQVIKLMKAIGVRNNKDIEVDSPKPVNMISPKGFSLEEYDNEVGSYVKTIKRIYQETRKFVMLEDRIWGMPPSFFAMDIYLKKIGNQKCKPINFSSLSSGERQMVFVLSTLVYHLINIISVDDDRIQYNAAALIMDEVELCFHPDYQRVFLNHLLKLLEHIDINNILPIHIIVTTHSPFILSDIPESCILYLKDGTADVSKKQSTFGANVLDLLHQSFFMKDGYTGEIARQKIEELGRLLNDVSDNSNIDRKEIESTINIIGDPIIKQQLWYMYDNWLHRKGEDAKAERIAKLRAELQILERGL